MPRGWRDQQADGDKCELCPPRKKAGNGYLGVLNSRILDLYQVQVKTVEIFKSLCLNGNIDPGGGRRGRFQPPLRAQPGGPATSARGLRRSAPAGRPPTAHASARPRVDKDLDHRGHRQQSQRRKPCAKAKDQQHRQRVLGQRGRTAAQSGGISGSAYSLRNRNHVLSAMAQPSTLVRP